MTVLQKELQSSNIKDIYRLSPLQLGIFFHALADSASSAYSSQLCYRVFSDMKPLLIEQSMGILLQRHDVLRTVFRHQKSDEILQIVLKNRKPDFQYHDISERDDQAQLLAAFRKKDREMTYNLGGDLLMRLAVFKLNETTFEFIWSHHHIIMDGWCTPVLLQEFNEIYNSLLHDKTIQLGEALQYGTFIKWLEKQDANAAIHFWQNYLQGYEQKTSVPRMHAPQHPQYINREVVLEIPTALSKEIHQVAMSNRTTLNTIFQGVWAILLSRFTDRPDIVFGTVVSLRPAEIHGIESVIGLLINTIPVRIRVNENESFIQLLLKNQQEALQTEPFRYHPLAAIQSLTPLKHQLIDHLFITENFPISDLVSQLGEKTAGDMIKAAVTDDFSQTNYDFNIILLPGETIRVRFNYNAAVYDELYIRQLSGSFLYLLEQVAAYPNRPIGSLEIMREEQQQEIVAQGMGREGNYTGTIHSVFREKVMQYPSAIAIVDEEGQISYTELEKKSNEKCAELLAAGLKPGDCIGVMTGRCCDMVVSLLAISKAGAIYLPLDPVIAQNRLQYMLTESNVQFVIARPACKDRFQFYNGNIICSSPAVLQNATDTIDIQVNPADTAYIIYTSGTTGLPKAVPIRQESIVSRVLYHNEYLELCPADRFQQFASVNFDASIIEMLMPLLSGGQLIILPEALKQNTEEMITWMEEKGVTGIIMPPAYIKILDHHPLPAVRHIISTGEAAIRDDVALYAQTKNVYNGYGPTEVCIGATFHKVSSSLQEENAITTAIPIGKPFADTGIYVMDQHQRLMPPGLSGEICISGIGLSSGYPGYEEQTQQKFVNAFFGTTRVYRTGDLGRWNEKGELEYLGRLDDQVQINGIRVETAEIAYTLRQHVMIKDAVVRCVQSETAPVLIAYIITKEELDSTGVKNFLREYLPAYMIPGHIFTVANWPLTSNGKIDFQNLPLPESKIAADDMGNGLTALQQLLLGAVSGVLGCQVNLSSDFFWSGGDSIKAIQVASRMHRKGYRLEVNDIFKYPVLLDMVQQVQPLVSVIDQGVVTGMVESTPVLYEFDKLGLKNPEHFIQSLLLRSAERLDVQSLKTSLQLLQSHHDALRITFIHKDGVWQGMNHGLDLPVSTNVVDLRHHLDAAGELTKQVKQLQQGIDMANGPLMKSCLYQLPDGDRLQLVIHHTVVDGVSWRFILEDLQHLYRAALDGEALSLPSKTNSYKQWAAALKAYSNSDAFVRQQGYWLNISKKAESLPLSSSGASGSQGYVTFSLNEEETESLLRKVNQAFGTEINEVLLAAISLAMNELFGMKSISVMMEGHGRENILPNINISRTAGWFTCLYPVLVETGDTTDLSLHIRQIKELLRAIPDKGIGYGLWKYLRENKDSQLPVSADETESRILLNYLGQFDEDAPKGQFSVAAEQTDDVEEPGMQPAFAISFSAMVSQHIFKATMRYDQSLINEELAIQLHESFKSSLRHIILFCSNQPERVLTPCDLTFRGLSISQVENMQMNYRQQYGTGMRDVYRLTPMQEGMLYHWLTEKNSPAYIYQVSYRLCGDISIGIVRETVDNLIDRHDVLRTLFEYRGYQEMLQVVLEKRKAEVVYYDLTTIDSSGWKEQFAEFTANDRQRGFDLNSDILIRLGVFRHSLNEVTFLWTSHHIILDGWCMGTLVKEFNEIYTANANYRKNSLAPASSFGNYIKWLSEKDPQQSLDYWNNYLSGYTSALNIPGAAVKNKTGNTDIVKHTLQFTTAQTEGLLNIAQESKVTLNTLLQTGWGLLLAKYNNTRDVVFGCVVSGRPAAVNGIESMIGLFINTIPVRVMYEPSDTVVYTAQQTQKDALAAEPYHYSSLAQIQSQTSVKQNLVSVVLDFNNYPVNDAEGKKSGAGHTDENNWEITDVQNREQTSYDLFISVVSDKQLQFQFYYNPEIYTKEIIAQLASRFQCIMQQVLENKWISADAITLSDKSEEKVLLGFSKGDKKEYPVHTGYAAQFMEQAARSPGLICVNDDREEWSYKKTDDWSSSLAYSLRTVYNLKSGDVVAVYADRSVYLPASIIGIWKAGGVYLPLNKDLPAERIEKMLHESGATIILADNDEQVPGKQYSVVIRVHDIQLRDATDVSGWMSKGNEVAYLLYTSGSTGSPKGVMVEQCGMLNHLHSRIERYGLNRESKVAQTAVQSFDISIWQLFAALLAGGRVCIYSKDVQLQISIFTDRLVKDRITVLQLVPAYLVQLLEHIERLKKTYTLPSLQKMIAVGEELKPSLVNLWYRHFPGKPLINTYGPTEAADIIADYDVVETTSYDTVPVGKPISNMSVYVLDNGLQLCPVGIIGDICVAGIGVGRGYLGMPDKTAAVFLEDPFQKNISMYKTGDVGCWSQDGVLLFYGRKDYQVKINGHRVELGEIENVLLKYAGITQAIAVYRNNMLVAFINKNKHTDIAGIREWLVLQLPAYMVPSSIIPLSVFPVTASGKVDRARLPMPADREYIEPSAAIPLTAEESLLVDIWEKVLLRMSISPDENFIELGGDSIKAMQVSSRCYAAGYKLDIKDIFQYPVIKQLAARLQPLQRFIDQSPVTGVVPLTPVQHRFFSIGMHQPHHYNQAFIFSLPSRVQPAIVQRILTAVIHHHDALRAKFELADASVIQTITGPGEIDYSCFDMKTDTQAEQSMVAEINKMHTGFSLEKGQLVKTALFSLPDADYLFVVAHHLVIDGVSWRIVMEDLAILLDQAANELPFSLPPKTDSYRTWANCLAAYTRRKSFANELRYWNRVLQQPVSPFPFEKKDFIPSDYYTERFYLSKSLTGDLTSQVPARSGMQLPEILLSALGLALNQAFGMESMMVDMEGHGREEIFGDFNFTRTAGWFTSIYPVHLNMAFADDLSLQLRKIKEMLDKIPNKGIGFGIGKYMGDEKEFIAHDPIILLNYLGQFDQPAGENNIGLSAKFTGNGMAPAERKEHLLNISGFVAAGQLQVNIEYCTQFFTRNHIEKFICDFEKAIENICIHCLRQESPVTHPGSYSYKELSIEDISQINNIFN